MKIFKSSQVAEIDAYTIKNEPIRSIDLMERASKTISDWITNKFSKKHRILVFVGPGNNGGDGLAVARLLLENNFYVDIYLCASKHSKDGEINLIRLQKKYSEHIKCIKTSEDFPNFNPTDIIIDGLFGSGLTRPISGFFGEIINHINKHSNTTIAIDIPSGLFGENNTNNDYSKVIKANYTIAFQSPKLSFMFAENHKFIGDFILTNIGLHKKYIQEKVTNTYFTEIHDVSPKFKARNKFSHKGDFGHALLIAGSYGMIGASVLATKSCLRAGAGLVTTHIPKCGYNILQSTIPEAMLSIDDSEIYFTAIENIEKFNAIGIGPGLGKNENSFLALKNLLAKANTPMVIDADALNIISEHKELLLLIPQNSILTPNLKEFERLFGKYKNSYTRNLAQVQVSEKYNFYIVLKGANTSVSCPNGNCYFNSTGNSGMSTAGSGDVLAGIILSFLAQSYSPEDSAINAVLLHGLAGDIAAKIVGEDSLIASDIVNNLGKAFLHIRKK